MACANVGEADADIAGIGVITAFTFQAIASWIFSFLLDVFLPNPPDQGLDRGSVRLHDTRPPHRSLLSITALRDEIHLIEQDFSRLADRIAEQIQQKPSTTLATISKSIEEYYEDFVQMTRSKDKVQDLLQEAASEQSPRQVARSIVAEVLYTSSDTQTLAGIALALVGIVRQSTLSLYQFHLIYDTINLTSVSNCAALASASAVDTSDLLTRVLLIFVFLILYLIFAILFGIRLDQWDNNTKGGCYNSHALAVTHAQHPLVDKIYLGITCLYMFVLLFLTLAMAISRCKVDPAWGKRRSAIVSIAIKGCESYASGFYTAAPLERWTSQLGLQSRIWYPLKVSMTPAKVNPVLTIAMAQLPLHLYYIIRIRMSNEPLLMDGSDENQWGFGQIYALITSAALVVECLKGYIKYWNAKQHFKFRAQQPAGADEKAEKGPNPTVHDFQNPDMVAREGQSTKTSP